MWLWAWNRLSGRGRTFSTCNQNLLLIRPIETRPVPLVYQKYFSSTCVTASVKQTGWSRKAFFYEDPKFHPNPTGRNASSTSCIPQVLFQYLCDCERETDCTGGHGKPFSTRIRNFIQIRPVETRPVPLVYQKYFFSTCVTVSVKWITQVVLEAHFLREIQISS